MCAFDINVSLSFIVVFFAKSVLELLLFNLFSVVIIVVNVFHIQHICVHLLCHIIFLINTESELTKKFTNRLDRSTSLKNNTNPFY